MMRSRLLILLLSLLVWPAAILTGGATADSLRDGSNQFAGQPSRQTTIAGRIMTSDGSSVTGFVVVLRRLGEDVSASGYQRIGPDGKFSFESLAGGIYTLLTIDDSSQEMHADLDDDGSPALHRPGDFVELLIKREKPGVITGTVTGQSGEPVVEAIIQAIWVPDRQGNPRGSPANLAAGNLQRKTDDRGVYRLWGLEPGTYVISAGGKSRGRSMLSAYDADAPTYYADSSSGSPRLVAVGPGQEVTGIDIQYHGGTGHKVSGILAGSYQGGAPGPRPGDQQARPPLMAVLTNTLTGEQQFSGIEVAAAPPGAFAFSETPDGEYEVSVITPSGPGGLPEAASESKRVTVNGADVTGIQLRCVTVGTISGRIVVEPAPGLKSGCAPKQSPKLDQVALIFGRTGKPVAASTWNPFSRSSSIDVGIDSQGNFPPTRFEPGAYKIKTDLPDDNFYLDSITLGAPSKPAAVGVPFKPVPLGPLFSIKEGQEISPVIISLGRGAARVSGHVVAPRDGAPLPAALEVYLVPAVAEYADKPLRFSMTRVRSGAAFVLANIPPGRYRIFVRPAKGSDQPVIESKDGRAALRRDAERTGVSLDLTPCQRLGGLALAYTP